MDLINNMGLLEEVTQQATTDGVLDAPNIAMKQVRKIRPEMMTSDPSLLKRFPNGGKGSEDMDEDDYMVEMMKALSGEYADDESMQGMTGGQRIGQLARKHPKQLDNFFGEVARRNSAEGDAMLQGGSNFISDIGDINRKNIEEIQGYKQPERVDQDLINKFKLGVDHGN